MSITLKIENVSKVYQLGKIGTGTLMNDLRRWWSIKTKGVDPFTLVGEENDRTKAGGEIVWALKDINLDVYEGDIIGLIGQNGAGKSTLLKLLSGVTLPTTGQIKIRGKMASLLEVGTGFHPELSGRENIYLNGAILGMTKADIRLRFDEIVEFSGVAKYLDTPVKRYSSGIKVRLGFAVAAHLEPDILIVDEVLAVGDAEFQKKAIGKMQSVSSEKGRTVIFVSHNMLSVKRLCNKGLVMHRGKLIYEGEVGKAIEYYLSADGKEADLGLIGKKNWNESDGGPGDHSVKVRSVELFNHKEENSVKFGSADEIGIRYVLDFKEDIRGFRLITQITDEFDNIIFSTTDQMQSEVNTAAGAYEYRLRIPGNLFNERKYFVKISGGIQGIKNIFPALRVLSFEVFFNENSSVPSFYKGQWPGLVAPKLEWKKNKLNN